MKTAVGLMSGTSMDGIDIALVYTDGEDQLVHENFPMFFPYDAKFREKLISSLDNAKLIKDRNERPGNLAKIEEELTRLHANAINEFLTKNNLAKNKIDVIGYSGQTVLHRPEIGLTVQIGDGQLLADLTGIDVAYDMRANDMVYGGQGAPLVPIYHKAIARDIKNKFHENGTLVIVNIGGISNVTVIEPEMPLIAFDCGPGNALLDQWMLEKEGKWFDENGKIAMQGKVTLSDARIVYLLHLF
uniref:Anhydro-N-acetylmuramic acid kinase n=1 Tax=Acrobeloides nanus TaxID=290746 RepID=A0A914D3R6_9BILA